MLTNKIILSAKDPLIKMYFELNSLENDIGICLQLLKILRSKNEKLMNDIQTKPKEKQTKQFTNEKMIIQSIYFNFIITYNKLFSSGTRIRFNPEDIFSSQILKNTHGELRKKRNKYIAHSVNFTGEKLKANSIFTIELNDDQHKWSYRVEPTNKRKYSALFNKIESYEELLNLIIEYFHKIYSETVNKIAIKYVPEHIASLGNSIQLSAKDKILYELNSSHFTKTDFYSYDYD